MYREPFPYHRQSPVRQITRIDRTVKRNQGFMFAIDSVEMSRRMLAPVHVDDDTEKAGYLRHGAPRNKGLAEL